MKHFHLIGAAVFALSLAACGNGEPAGDEAATETPAADAAQTDMAPDSGDMNSETGSKPPPDNPPTELAPEPENDASLEEAESWLAENAEREEVQVTDSGLQYEVLESGPEGGETPGPLDWVCVHYTGSLTDGTVFDSSREGGRNPLAYPAAGFIPAWIEALSMMKPGDRWMLYAHPDLAYGADGAGGVIPPNAALIFDMKLLGVVNGDDVPTGPGGAPDPDYNCAEAV